MKDKLIQNRKRIVLAVVAVILLLAGFLVYRSLQFRLVSTTPDVAAVSSASPSFTLRFSKQLRAGSLAYSTTDSFTEAPIVSGNEVKFPINNVLKNGKTYTIVIKKVESKDNKIITGKRVTFVAQNIPVKKLSKAQRNELMATQDRPVYIADHINYVGFNALLDYGVTSGQLDNIKGRLYDYSNTVNKQFWTMTLVSGSIVNTVHDAESETNIDTVDFNAQLGDQVFKVHAEYRLIYDSVHLTMYDQAGVLVYDSADAGD